MDNYYNIALKTYINQDYAIVPALIYLTTQCNTLTISLIFIRMVYSSSIWIILMDMNNTLIRVSPDPGKVASLSFFYGICLIMFRTFSRLKRFCFSILSTKISAGMLYPCNVPASAQKISERILYKRLNYWRGGW